MAGTAPGTERLVKVEGRVGVPGSETSLVVGLGCGPGWRFGLVAGGERVRLGVGVPGARGEGGQEVLVALGRAEM